MVDQNQGLRYAVWNVLCLFDAPRWASGVRLIAGLAGEQRAESECWSASARSAHNVYYGNLYIGR